MKNWFYCLSYVDDKEHWMRFDIMIGDRKIAETDVNFSPLYCEIRDAKNIAVPFDSFDLSEFLYLKTLPDLRDDKSIFPRLAGLEYRYDECKGFQRFAGVASYMLSLTDPLWINPQLPCRIPCYRYDDHRKCDEGKKLERKEYRDIEFRANGWTDDVAVILREREWNYWERPDSFSYQSPDICTTGRTAKWWERAQDGIWLHKQGYPGYHDDMYDNACARIEGFRKNGMAVPQIKKAPESYGYCSKLMTGAGDWLVETYRLKILTRQDTAAGAVQSLSKALAVPVVSDMSMLEDMRPNKGILATSEGIFAAGW